jgi:anti-sigma28 factor (negative regulator of flagellin synthesis)
VRDDANKPHPGKGKKTSPTAEKALQPELVREPVKDEIDPERREKIEKIKQALADGTYRISNQDVARKLIEHMRDQRREPQREPKS